MADALKKADDDAVARTKQFFIFNEISVVLAMIAGFVFYFVWVDTPILLAGEVYMTVLLLAIEWARRTITVDTLDSVGVGILVANWCTAIVLTLIAPFSYPLGVLQVIAPVIAAGPVLERKGLRWAIAGAALLTAGVTALGLGLSDTELNDKIPENIADAIVIAGVAVMTVPIGIGTFDAHARQTLALRRALHNAEQIRDSRTRLVRAADDERRRLERDLHDGAQQQLVAVAMQLRLLKNQADLAEEVDPLIQELEGALEHLRELAHGIYPPLLRSRGLTEALGAAARRAPLAVEVEAIGIDRYDADIEAAVYFCCLEALQNAAKHAGAGASAQISLAVEDNRLVGSVQDDGPGFNPPPDAAGAGLRNMEDRVGAVGGELRVVDDRGTRVEYSIPVPPPAD